jgi:predicted lipid-binding transport protein (Tim44 family)
MKMHKTKLREGKKIAAAITSSSTHDTGDDVTEDPPTTDSQQDQSSPSSDIERLEEAYQKALTAFKADKNNKDLRRAKKPPDKHWTGPSQHLSPKEANN